MTNNTSRCDRCELSIIAGEKHNCPLDSMTAYGLVLIGDRWFIDTVIRGTVFKDLTVDSIKPLPVPSWINRNLNTHFSTPKNDTHQDDRTTIDIDFRTNDRGLLKQLLIFLWTPCIIGGKIQVCINRSTSQLFHVHLIMSLS